MQKRNSKPRSVSGASIRILAAAVVLCFGGCEKKEQNPGAGTGPAKNEPKPVQVASPLNHGDMVPDAELVNQKGEKFKLSDFKGNVLVVSFFFSRCKSPTMCPLLGEKFKEVQGLLKEKAISDVKLLLVSFDVAHDKPEVLAKFGESHGADFTSWTIATGKTEVVGNLARSFNVYYRFDPPDAFEHNIIVGLVDRIGVFRDDFFGAEWDASEMVDAIKQIAK